ncbi:MAG: radical SAM family heme chaperone HemW [Firmicutes bacterium]|nr:radical SAM family heme chaperone HemW [Bacillota bacterium]
MMKINRKIKPAGLYIHIPFCLKKCGYCDFLSFGGCSSRLQEQYVEALKNEIGMYAGQGIKIDTVFIGGGTPSLLHENHITEIMKAAEAAFCITEDAEITIEANPKTLNADKLSVYRRAGINRLSMGAQAMNDEMLEFMGRAHDRADFLENFRQARQAGFDNINADLMFGIPGQTMEMWKDSLRQMIGLGPDHISFYSLQLEEGTEFARMYRNGEIDLPESELDREMYHEGIRMLKTAGYNHYEISNCAKPGHECRHNLKYWDYDEYYAVGLGAHSFTYKSGRRCNVSDFEKYFELTGAGLLPQDEDMYEEESLQDMMGEYVFTALRKLEGLSLDDFRETFGRDFHDVYSEQKPVLAEYAGKGLVIITDTHIALTVTGIDRSNEIMAEFV